MRPTSTNPGGSKTVNWGNGAEDQDDAERAGGEAGGGQEQGQSARHCQGGDAQAGAGERQAETQVGQHSHVSERNSQYLIYLN